MLSKRIKQKIKDEYGLSFKDTDNIYKLWWKQAKDIIESEGNEYTDINIPLLGKLVKRTNIDEKF